MIERISNSYRYRLTDLGLPSGWFFTRTYARIPRDQAWEEYCLDSPPPTQPHVTASISLIEK
jgi:hypothetical protein